MGAGQREQSIHDILVGGDTNSGIARARRDRRRRPIAGAARSGLAGLVTVGCSWSRPPAAASGGGRAAAATSDDRNIMLHTVARGDFELNVTERGEVEAFDVTEVRSLVKSNNTTGNAILRIVPEGTVVKKGDFLVELDSSALAAQRTSQKILVNAAKAAEVEAHNNYDTAVIAKREYLEGTYLQERQTIESEVFVAEENLNRAKEYYAYSQKLASKGYVNENCNSRPIASPSRRRRRTSTRPRRSCKVLDEFTKPKMLSTLESAILIAKAKWDSAQNSHELELEKLHDLDDQIAKCTIVGAAGRRREICPRDGRPRRPGIHRRGRHDRPRAADDHPAAERRFDARQPDGERIAGSIRAAGPGGGDQPGRLRRPRAARHGRKGQSIRRADRLAAGERQGIQGVRQHRRSAARFAVGHDGGGHDPLCRSAERAAGAGAGDVRARRQVLLLRVRPGQMGSARE